MTNALVTQLLVDLEELPEDARTGVLTEENRRLEHTGGAAQRRVLIIGGAGYIGAPVTSALLQAGAHVRVLDNNTYLHADAIVGYLPHPHYEYVHGDMGDQATLDGALQGVTDVVILAGLVGDPITKKFPDEAHAINDLAMHACIDHLHGKGLNKVIFVSTCSNYGLIKEDERAHEEFELSPLSLYAKSKVAAEQYILSKRGTVDYHPTVLRFATAFGLAPRMRFDLTVNEFTRDLAIGKELVVFDAHTWRPYCHVKDFARLIRRVFAYPVETTAFEVFNAGGDKNNQTKQGVVDLITARLPGAKVSYKANSSDPRNYRVDFSKVRQALDFEPSFSVDDGIEEIIWALGAGLLADVEQRRDFYGNYDLKGLRRQSPANTAPVDLKVAS